MGNSSSKSRDSETSRGHAAVRSSHPNADENVGEPEQLSYYQMMKQGYQELVNAIIRPPRCSYDVAQLGPKSFDYCGKIFERKDFDLINQRGMKVVCSMWEPAPQSRQCSVLPCVIYMHGNSSARVEALTQLSLVLSLGATLVSFDFCGSGKSDGEFVSLGAFEKDDLKCVIEHLRDSGKTSTIALWGRSMGAATALLHGERDPSIAGMVLDSAFADLTMLAEEMVEKGRQHGLFAPGFVVKMAIRMIRATVMKTADFDIRLLSPIEHADRCFIPALFVAAEGDEFVPPHHSQRIYEKYAGDKNVIIVVGDHNSNRPRFLFDSATIFLVHILQIPPSWMLNNASSKKMGLPWSSTSSSSSSSVAKKKAVSKHRTSNRGENKEGSSSSSKTHSHHHSSHKNSSSSGRSKAVDEPILEEESEIGMTKERQADVRGNLYSMLGDRGQVAAASSSSSSRTREHPRSSTKEHSRSSTKEYSTKSKEGSSTAGCDTTSSSEATHQSGDFCSPYGDSTCSGTSVLCDELRVSVSVGLRGGGEDAGRTGEERVQSPIGMQHDIMYVNDNYGDGGCNNHSNVTTKNSRNNENVHNNHQGVGISSKNRDRDKDKDQDHWVCVSCTLINEATYRRCFTCNSIRDGCRE